MQRLPNIVLAGCWAHTYRKFVEAEPDHPEANLSLGWISELYAIDDRAGDDIQLRLELRRTESAAVLEKLKTWLWSQAVLKTQSIGRAAAYAIAYPFGQPRQDKQKAHRLARVHGSTWADESRGVAEANRALAGQWPDSGAVRVGARYQRRHAAALEVRAQQA